MSEPGPSPSIPGPSTSGPSTSTYVDFLLYASAAVTYISLGMFHKWLLNWVLGPVWLLAWVWGLPALWKLIRRQPIRPQHGRRPDV